MRCSENRLFLHKKQQMRKRIEAVITALTRNQVARKGSWVRIPPLPLNKCRRKKVFRRRLYVLHLHKAVAYKKLSQYICEHFQKVPFVQGITFMETDAEQKDIRPEEEQST